MSDKKMASSKCPVTVNLTVKTLCVILFFMISITTSLSAKTQLSNFADAVSLSLKGGKLSAQQAQKLENDLTTNPENLSARTRLLGYYMHKSFFSAAARKAHQRHVLWVIQHHPDSAIAGMPDAQLNPVLDEEVYYKAKKLWVKQAETHKNNTAILGNAARFFLIYDKDIAEKLLKKAQSFEPNNPKWSARLGELYNLEKMRANSPEAKRKVAAKSLKAQERSLKATTGETEKFYKLSDLARTAFDAGDMKKAETYATELLDMVARYKSNWNYGNAIHHANLILGRIALKSGKIKEAKAFLLKAGETPGSPQLNSFGPNMTLTKELLEKGEREVVIEYFQLCGRFWKMGKTQLNKWTAIVKAGRMPDFGANLNY